MNFCKAVKHFQVDVEGQQRVEMLNVEKIVKGWTQKIGYPSRVIERGKVGMVDIVHGQVGVIDHKKNGAERMEDQVVGSVGAQQKDNED